MRPNASIHLPTVISGPIPPLNLFAKPMVKPRPQRIRPRRVRVTYSRALNKPTVTTLLGTPFTQRRPPRRIISCHYTGPVVDSINGLNLDLSVSRQLRA